jgi:hypothetical protein
MAKTSLKWLALLSAVTIGAASMARAQDSGALLDVLVKKGILSDQEAEDVRADLGRDFAATPWAVAGGKSTTRLSVGGRMHLQYAHLNTDIADTGADPVATSNFLVRRMYLTFKAGLGPDWGAQLTYDFASQSYDDAIVQWKPNSDLNIDMGLRKVNVAFEERYTFGDIRAIERSPVTRYFVENKEAGAGNDRKLGAGSYRTGVHADGKFASNLVWSAAITNPQRQDSWTSASTASTAATNNVAFFATFGTVGKFQNGIAYDIGVGGSLQPDQGGFNTATLGKGNDLELYSFHALLSNEKFMFMTEFLMANVERGVNATTDATPTGFFIQPSYYISDKLEAVLRYSYLDSDGRGVTLADGLRSAPSGGTMDKLTEYYVGANYYLKGQDLKFQLGLVYGKTEDKVTGASAKAETVGVRSQVQLQF